MHLWFLVLSVVNVQIVCCDTSGQEQAVCCGGSVAHTDVQARSGGSISAYCCVSRDDWCTVCEGVRESLPWWTSGGPFAWLCFDASLCWAVLVVLTRRRWCVLLRFLLQDIVSQGSLV